MLVYPPCKKCGKSHGMGIEEMATGKIDPIDLCYDCLWEGFPNHVNNIRELNDIEYKENCVHPTRPTQII